MISSWVTMPDHDLGDALRAVADQIERSGRLPGLTDIYERARARRKRRRAATAALAVLLTGGLAATQAVQWAHRNPAATEGGERPLRHPATQVGDTPPPSPEASVDPLLSGRREVSIARTPGTAVSLDGGFLTEIEADDDSGRRLFVLTPLGGGDYLIKAFGRNVNHPASDEPACWQVYREPGQPLTVQGAVCDPADPDQKFTIKTSTPQTYAISNASAYLKRSPTGGLILATSQPGTFRLTDQGPARKPAGG
jgi:hypothetical protein